ncbi:unnamed protein product [Paramecium octaurelia]|uniref:Protein kinase domain-containing protein n=1 Tax=Paramecium octaurelia TaxID=43137 RepID=A0A8S1YGH5_PAROT|nr:unnamed protein product [Paramecium octaurelia]
MQQENPENPQARIEQQIDRLRQIDELRDLGKGRQGICINFKDRVYKFLNLNRNNNLSIEELRRMNQNELHYLQLLTSSDYTCEVQSNECDDENLWITTAYMNLGTLDMDCLFNQQQQFLEMETIRIICVRLLNILNYFHNNRIFHLDVNPTNILFHEEFQFFHENRQNDLELPIEQGLQSLSQDLRAPQKKQLHLVDNKIHDYTNLQYILNQKFSNLQPNQRGYLIEYRFADEHVAQLVFWIRRWLKLQNRETFNPKCIQVKKGIRICFCDFGLSRSFENNDFNRPEFRDGPYKTPYEILGRIVYQNERIEAWKIARYQDLFCLGITMMNLLINNGYAEIEPFKEDEKDLEQFLQQTYGLHQLKNACHPDDYKELLTYYVILRWLEQNMNNDQTLRLIYRMLKFNFNFTSDIPLNLQEDQDIPLENIKTVQNFCRLLTEQYG